jgi:hypothetical protein
MPIARAGARIVLNNACIKTCVIEAGFDEVVGPQIP